MTSDTPQAATTVENFPVVCCTSILGLRPIKVFKTIWIGYLYMLGILAGYYALFFYTFEHGRELYHYLDRPSYSAIYVRYIRLFFNIIYLPLMIISSAINFDKVKASYSNLNELDQKLKLFNANFSYATLMRKNIVCIVGFILFSILICLTDYYNFKKADSDKNNMYNLFWFSTQFPQMVNSVAISAFVVLVADVTRRFQVINKIILKLKTPKNDTATALSQDVNNVFQFKLLQQCYNILSNIIVEINESYGFIVSLSLIIYLFGMVAHVSVAVRNMKEIANMVDCFVDALWTLFYFGNITYIVSKCHAFHNEGKRASKVLHEYRVDSDNHLLKQECESFAQQVRNLNVKITASHFFDIDYPLLCKVVLGMAAYVVFLSQFYRLK